MQLSGFTFAYISCPEPFGPGVQAGTYSATVNATTGTVTQEGTYTNWYATGTTHGTFSPNLHRLIRVYLPTDLGIRAGLGVWLLAT
jgi:hypothetical protein